MIAYIFNILGTRHGVTLIKITFFVRTRQATAAAAAATEAATTAANPTGMDLELPVDPNEPTYCFCNQVSYGEMVACDNTDVCNPFLSFSFFLLNFSSTFSIYDLMKAPVTLSTVQNRMVPFWLCWSKGAAKRKMVLLRLCCAKKSSERQMMLGSYSWPLYYLHLHCYIMK